MAMLLLVLLLSASALAQRNTNRDFLFENRAYFVVDAALPWAEALQTCQRRGATLSVANSADQAEDIKKIMMAYNLASIHTGFHDVFTEADYVTVYGDSLRHYYGQNSAWAPSFPRGGSRYNCGGFSLSGFMDVDCADALPFICGDLARIVDRKYPPGFGYEYIRGLGYYKYYKSTAPWTVAEKTCRSEGAHLVVLNSPNEANALVAKFTPGKELTSWVGVHRFLGGDYDFVTLLGGMYNSTGYIRWMDKQPAGNYKTFQVALYFQSTTRPYGFASAGVSSGTPFICEVV